MIKYLTIGAIDLHQSWQPRKPNLNSPSCLGQISIHITVSPRTTVERFAQNHGGTGKVIGIWMIGGQSFDLNRRQSPACRRIKKELKAYLCDKMLESGKRLAYPVKRVHYYTKPEWQKIKGELEKSDPTPPWDPDNLFWVFADEGEDWEDFQTIDIYYGSSTFAQSLKWFIQSPARYDSIGSVNCPICWRPQKHDSGKYPFVDENLFCQRFLSENGTCGV